MLIKNMVNSSLQTNSLLKTGNWGTEIAGKPMIMKTMVEVVLQRNLFQNACQVWLQFPFRRLIKQKYNQYINHRKVYDNVKYLCQSPMACTFHQNGGMKYTFQSYTLVEEFICVVHNEEVKDLRNKMHISVIRINIKQVSI